MNDKKSQPEKLDYRMIPKQAEKGLRMLAYDIKNLLRQDGDPKQTSLRYNFFDTIQIIVIMVLCGVAIGTGVRLILDPAGFVRSVLGFFGL